MKETIRTLLILLLLPWLVFQVVERLASGFPASPALSALIIVAVVIGGLCAVVTSNWPTIAQVIVGSAYSIGSLAFLWVGIECSRGNCF